ncbi:MAG: cell division protein FtsZ [Luteolibacter sp.]|uniref:cell division protein FtsZ n=1 Tax=Luteolibacter sp. TaxID=1962973 RepID=UPI0032630C47
MIPYTRDPQQTIPTSAVKIIGLGGAGANMLERIALDGMEGAELLALNTDVRTLASCVAREKIQLGVNLTKGLGAGGDPELGHQAMLESEDQIRASIKGRRIVFLCTGLGGGTGSGASPIVTRIAREEGAFVVVFATMPFAFEGKRRREQAETALNELAVLSNALVTFDNNRMGELVLAKQGIHEAFAAADHMICESIKAVIRLVIRPGLINVGLDDLMSALRTNRSRCLFGSGIAEGKDRASKALKNALNSPLLDQGALLKDAQTVLVHLSGGEDLTLFEIELLMQRLQKFVPDKAHVLFGAAVDPAMGDSLSITLISALPEDSLAMAPRESLSHRSPENPILDPSQGFTSPPVRIADFVSKREEEPEPEPVAVKPVAVKIPEPFRAPEPPPRPEPVAEPAPVSPLSKFRKAATNIAAAAVPSLFDNERPFAEPDYAAKPKVEDTPESELDAFTFTEVTPPAPVVEPEPEVEVEIPVVAEAPQEEVFYNSADEPDPEPIEEFESDEPARQPGSFTPGPKRRPSLTAPWGKTKNTEFPEDIPDEEPVAEEARAFEPEAVAAAASTAEHPKLKLGVKPSGSQSELGLDSAPRGRFEGETPNVFDGEDLDLPPFLRKKK